MKFYIEDPKDGVVKPVPTYVSDSILKQYLEKKYTLVVAIGCFLLGFFAGIIAYAL